MIGGVGEWLIGSTNRPLTHSTNPTRIHSPPRRAILPLVRSRDLVALEFPRVCARVADFAASVAGQQRCQALHPARERGTAEAALDRTAQMVDLLERHGDPPLRAFADVRADVGRAAHEGLALDGRALVAVRATLETLRLVGAYLRRHAESDGALRALCADVVAFPQHTAAFGSTDTMKRH